MTNITSEAEVPKCPKFVPHDVQTPGNRINMPSYTPALLFCFSFREQELNEARVAPQS